LKRFIKLDDFYDLYHKFKQRGLRFILSKFNSRSILRTKSAFNQTRHESADWWVIPTVRERWNKMISGNPKEEYISFFVDNYLSGKKNLKLISFGSGSCSAEIELAKHGVFEEIVEKPFGGSILMTVLKDISHHFLELNDEKSLILTKLFDFEDIYLKNHSSDFIFGVYKKKHN